MEPTNPNDTPQLSLRERFFKSWFPPAAVVGGVVTLVAAALRVRPEPRAQVQAPADPAARPAPDGLLQVQRAKPDSAVPIRLERQYVLAATIGGSALSSRSASRCWMSPSAARIRSWPSETARFACSPPAESLSGSGGPATAPSA